MLKNNAVGRRAIGKLWKLSKVLLFLYLLIQFADKVPIITSEPFCITWYSSTNFNISDFDEMPLPHPPTQQFTDMLATVMFVDRRLRSGTSLPDENKIQNSFMNWILRGFDAQLYVLAAKKLVYLHQWEPYLSKEWVGGKMIYSNEICRDVAKIMTTEPPRR